MANSEREAVDTVLVQLYFQLNKREAVEALAKEDLRCLLVNTTQFPLSLSPSQTIQIPSEPGISDKD